MAVPGCISSQGGVLDLGDISDITKDLRPCPAGDSLRNRITNLPTRAPTPPRAPRIHLVLATRRSPLARAQTELVAAALRAAGHTTEALELVTTGDRWSASGTDPAPDGGSSSRSSRRRCATGGPTWPSTRPRTCRRDLPEGLGIVAVPGREDARDVLVGVPGGIDHMPEGARVGTGSPRAAQMLDARPDAVILPVRGNVGTRRGEARRRRVRRPRAGRGRPAAPRPDPARHEPPLGGPQHPGPRPGPAGGGGAARRRGGRGRRGGARRPPRPRLPAGRARAAVARRRSSAIASSSVSAHLRANHYSTAAPPYRVDTTGTTLNADVSQILRPACSVRTRSLMATIYRRNARIATIEKECAVPYRSPDEGLILCSDVVAGGKLWIAFTKRGGQLRSQLRGRKATE